MADLVTGATLLALKSANVVDLAPSLLPLLLLLLLPDAEMDVVVVDVDDEPRGMIVIVVGAAGASSGCRLPSKKMVEEVDLT